LKAIKVRPDWAPLSIDIDRPSAARMYDYILGGSHNFAADRQLVDKILALMPDMAGLAQANRTFLRRVVTYLAASGIRQFLDLGSGIPTRGNVHDTADQAGPDSRTVYVDFDPVAVAHSRALLAGNDRTAVVQADLRDPDAVLRDVGGTGLLDLDEPIGLLLVAVLHFIPDDDNPHDVVSRLCAALPRGSYLAISHLTADSRGEDIANAQELAMHAAGPWGTPRSYAQVARFFDGLQLVGPGLTWAALWRSDQSTTEPENASLASVIYGGVARKA
jgi:hypothetical protein